MQEAEVIRDFVGNRYVQPARARGDLVIAVRAGDVTAALGLPNGAVPAVCQALGDGVFERQHEVQRVNVLGPIPSITTIFVYTL